MIITERIVPDVQPLQTLNLAHLKRLTTEIGVWQHCRTSEPHLEHGYSIDDVVRALIVAVELWRRDVERPFCEKLGPICLSFIERASMPDGTFHNFANHEGKWVDSVGSQDSFGRTLWALALAHQVNLFFAPADRIRPIIDRAMQYVPRLDSYRSQAFVLQALSYLPENMSAPSKKLLRTLQDAFAFTASNDWQWYENTMTYCNGRVPIALMLASKYDDEPDKAVSIALQMLDFLLKSCRLPEIGGYAPVGNDGWFKRGDSFPPTFDQQPVDAGVLVEACILAWKYSGNDKYAVAAYEAMEWYHGRNVFGVPVYDPETGGVCDALTPKGLNINQGAESIVTYIIAAVALEELNRPF